MEKSSRFNLRAFVAIGLVFSGFSLPITGIANHVYQFEVMSAARHAWMAAHNSLGLLFVIFSVWHVIMNRKALARYLRGLTTNIPTISRETLAAAVVVAFVLFLSVGHAFH